MRCSSAQISSTQPAPDAEIGLQGFRWSVKHYFTVKVLMPLTRYTLHNTFFAWRKLTLFGGISCQNKT